MSSSAFPTKLTKTALFTICGVCWVLQSLPAFLLYMDGQEIVQYKTKVASQLLLPQLLICNRFPFTQAGLSSLGQQFQRDSVLSYLRQWLDPSLSASPPEDPFSTPLTETDRQQAEQIIAQLLPNGRLKQRLEQLMPQCQDMISSCVVGSRQLGGFDCCRMVQPWLATPRAGICWPFVGNLSSIQSPLDYPRGLQITFQISRNSYLSSSLTVHPGLDLYLIPPEMHNRLRVATSIGDPFPLNDKRTLRMDIRKEIHKHNELINFCLSSAEHVQPKQMVPSASGGLICMMDKAIRKCSCVPMLIVLWTLQNDLDSTFLRQFNASTICTVGEFDQCIRPYIEFAMPQGWTEYTVPENGPKELKDALEECKKSSFIPCQNIQFNSRTNERDLPAEYRNTQDFVSRLSLSFDSFLVKEVTVAKQMDLYQLLSTFGINLWWFAIGHLIWSICRFRCFGPHYSSSNLKGGNRIDPKGPMIPAASSSVGVVLGPAHNPSISSQPVNNGGGQQFEPNFPNQIQNNQTLGLGGGGARQLPPLAIPNQNLMGNGTMVEGPAMDRQIEVEEEEPAGR